MKRLILAATVAALVGNVSCSSKDTGSGAVEGATTGDAQTPPTGEAAVESWLAGKMYNAWKCEPTPHAPRPPSPHGNDRICSNDLLSKHEGGGD
jgi:hypothetical protein